MELHDYITRIVEWIIMVFLLILTWEFVSLNCLFVAKILLIAKIVVSVLRIVKVDQVVVYKKYSLAY